VRPSFRATRTASSRRRHPGIRVGARGRPIRSGIARTGFPGAVTSASWKMMYRAVVTTFAPILTSLSRGVVRD